ncbi:MAG: hypothetical protein AAGI38_24255 [Bacteroidota bacterium]
MKYPLLTFVFLFFLLQVKSQDRIKVRIPSPEEEAEYVWSTIQDINFFEAHNYQLSLPEGKIIVELLQKARTGSLSNESYPRLERFLRDSIYQKEAYQKGYDKIHDQLNLLNEMVAQLDSNQYNWEFKSFETYTVNLTLYGPGGSYSPNEGLVLLFTTPSGQFKGYKNPTNIIIHEIVHIGIEASIINRYQVPHTLKERIVDKFVILNFRQHLPTYQIQDMGEYRIDPYLKEVEDLITLNKIVATLLNR